MSKPLYQLRAERELACEKLFDCLSWYCERDELTEALENYCRCQIGASQAETWIEDEIDERDYRTRGELLILWADVREAVSEVYQAERREVAELLALAGRAA